MDVHFWTTSDGEEPVRAWLRGELSQPERLRAGKAIATVQENPDVGMPTCRAMKGGLFEVRANLGNRIARILFCFHQEQIVLLHAFIKKTPKTPAADLNLARYRQSTLKR